jgi:hypothetical protein
LLDTGSISHAELVVTASVTLHTTTSSSSEAVGHQTVLK